MSTEYGYDREEYYHQETNEQRESQLANQKLKFFSDSNNDSNLTEENTLQIEQAWNLSYSRGRSEKGRHFESVLNEEGVVIGSREVDPVAEGYWYAPIRETTQSIYSKNPTSEITCVQIAKTPMEAIEKAKRSGLNTLMSDHENLLNLEVLLSGELKFEGQDKPRWFPVQYITDGEAETLDRAARQWVEENGYEVKE